MWYHRVSFGDKSALEANADQLPFSELHMSIADGSIALFCYPIFGGQTCMTPTGQASLSVTQTQIVS